jgi:RNA polymerase-binding transcription factor
MKSGPRLESLNFSSTRQFKNARHDYCSKVTGNQFLKKIMKIENISDSSLRIATLSQILEHERASALQRVRELRERHVDDGSPTLSDELDNARSLSDLATDLVLIERAERRLRGIDIAFTRLRQGQYGVCPQCGDEIALERLQVVPFAAYCIDCQEERAGKPYLAATTNGSAMHR